MDSLGINVGFLIVQLVGLLLTAGWVIFSLLTILALRRQRLPIMPQALWAALIVLAPILGALAFWIVRPGQPASNT